MVDVAGPVPSTLVLRDGRRLAFHEYGAPDGVACVYLPGTPSSGLAGAEYDEAAAAAGVRLICVDKPGYGGSDRHARRTLRDLATDVAALADHLGFARFGVIGESGGGPHALAVAHDLPDRLSVAVVVAGMGPATEPWVLDGMKPANRRLLAVGRRAPWALHLPMWLTRRALLDPARAARLIARQIDSAGPADRSALQDMAAHLDLSAPARDALRASGRGAAQELSLLSRPWGFAIEAIRCPVHLWHGTEDVNVPPAVAEQLAARLPHATLHLVPDAGHAVGWSRRTEILAAVALAAKVAV